MVNWDDKVLMIKVMDMMIMLMMMMMMMVMMITMGGYALSITPSSVSWEGNW